MGFRVFIFSIFVISGVISFFFILGIVFAVALTPALASDFKPYELIDENDKFKVIITTNSNGKATALTYRYEYFD